MITWTVLEVDTGPPGSSGKQLAVIRGMHKSRVLASGQRHELSRQCTLKHCTKFKVMGITTAMKNYQLEL